MYNVFRRGPSSNALNLFLISIKFHARVLTDLLLQKKSVTTFGNRLHMQAKQKYKTTVINKPHKYIIDLELQIKVN